MVSNHSLPAHAETAGYCHNRSDSISKGRPDLSVCLCRNFQERNGGETGLVSGIKYLSQACATDEPVCCLCLQFSEGLTVMMSKPVITILAVNTGSSSIKFSLYESGEKEELIYFR